MCCRAMVSLTMIAIPEELSERFMFRRWSWGMDVMDMKKSVNTDREERVSMSGVI
jgi:hypothetical protein